MITFSFSMPVLKIAIACGVLGAAMLSAGVVYALGVITGPHCDGEGIAPVIWCLLWKKEK